jgi:uncharacterized membrane protein
MIKKIILILSLIVIAYGFLPVQIPKKWNDKIGENAVLGHILQSTGGDFFVKKETIISDLVDKNTAINEIYITGKTPTSIYSYQKNYDVLMADFILIGEITDIENEEGLGSFYVFNVEEFHLASYVPKIWNSSLPFILSFGLALIVFPFITIIMVIKALKRK